MNKIALIIPYYGTFPIWFDIYIDSLKNNPEYDFLFFTSIKYKVKKEISNIKFFDLSFEKLKELASNKLGFNVNIDNPYKICDLKPGFGLIFQDYIFHYEYWGHCDIDMFYGKLNYKYKIEKVRKYDILSSRSEIISGAFNLYRNSTEINTLYLKIPNIKNLVSSPKSNYIDEYHTTKLIKGYLKNEYKILWDEIFTAEALIKIRGRKKWAFIWIAGDIYDLLLFRRIPIYHFIESKNKQRFTSCFNDAKDYKGYIITESEVIFFNSIIEGLGKLIYYLIISIPSSYKYIFKRVIKRYLFGIRNF